MFPQNLFTSTGTTPRHVGLREGVKGKFLTPKNEGKILILVSGDLGDRLTNNFDFIFTITITSLTDPKRLRGARSLPLRLVLRS
jgi:hypothetical protein